VAAQMIAYNLSKFAVNLPAREEITLRSVSSLVQFKRGDHICIFYRDEPSLVNTLVHYLVAGLRRHERCFCVQKPHIIPQLLQGLGALGVNTDLEIQLGALEVHTDNDFIFPADALSRRHSWIRWSSRFRMLWLSALPACALPANFPGRLTAATATKPCSVTRLWAMNKW
jgi:hypothetical protein